MGRFVRVDDRSGAGGRVAYASGFAMSDRTKWPGLPLLHDNDELALADLIDETPALVPVVLPVVWFQAAPKLRAVDPDTVGDPWGVALLAERFPSRAEREEGDFILDIENATKLTQFAIDARAAAESGTRAIGDRVPPLLLLLAE